MLIISKQNLKGNNEMKKILEILLAMDKCLQVIGLGSNICQKYIKPKRLSFLTLFVVVPI